MKTIIKKTLLSAAFVQLLAVGFTATPANAYISVGIGVSIGFAPPALPVYVQPLIPGPNYIWTPGYWAWDPVIDDFYWVPGTWVVPPRIGYLWTPGYWGFVDGLYVWNGGYWGPRVGFYGGINYGFGYTGIGYIGGQWRGSTFYYNSAVNNVARVGTVYRGPVGMSATVAPSFTTRRASRTDLAFARQGIAATSLQQQHQTLASRNTQLRASVNHGAPTIAATPSAGRFSGSVATQRSETFTAPNRSGNVNRSGPTTRSQPTNARVRVPRSVPERSVPRAAPQKSYPQQHMNAPRSFQTQRPSSSPRSFSQPHMNSAPHMTSPRSAPSPRQGSSRPQNSGHPHR